MNHNPSWRWSAGMGLVLALQAGAALAQPAAPGTRTIEEVVVTAQKREESIQDVPVAVTALSDLQLDRAGVQDLRDLPTLSASFNMNGSQTESQGSVFRIRGVGTTGNNIGLESAVGVFLDGVHLSRPGIALGDLVDVEAVEVLRGPQGTLFGRNTSAGALVVRSKAPNLLDTEAWVNAGFGNFDSSTIQAGGNLPLIEDTLAVRGSVAFRRQNGFMKSETGAESMDRNRISVRGQVLWNINDRADLRIIADFADASEQCCDAIIRVDSPFREPGEISGLNAFEAAGLPADGGAPNVGNRAFNNRRSNAEQFENPFEQWGVSAELNWDLGGVDLTYLGSYRYFDAKSVQAADFVGTDVFSVQPEAAGGFETFDEIETTTHELRFAGDTGRLQWMIGGFFMWEDIVEHQGLGLGRDFSANTSANLFGLLPDPVLLPVLLEDLTALTIPGTRSPLQFDGSFLATQDPARAFTGGVDPFNSYAQNRFNQTTKSWSIFTHNTLRLTDQFDFVFGLRWVDEDKDGSFEQLAVNNSAACLNAQDNAAAFGDTGAAGFAAITAGFTCFPFVAPAGTGRVGLPSEFDNNFGDEELIWTVRGVYRFTGEIMGYVSFTHGFKAGGFNLDATAAALTPQGPADPSFDSETIDAWEVGLKTDLFNRRARLNTTLFYQDIDDFQVLEFTGVQFTTFNVPKAESKGVEVELLVAPINQLDVNIGVTYQDAKYPSDCDGGVFNPTVSALCGNRLTNASDWVGVAGLTWQDALPGTALTYFVHTNVRAESKRRTSTQFVDPTSGNPLEIPFQGSNTKLNLRLGVGPSDGAWTFELWGNNLTDKQTTNNTANVPLRGVGSLDTPARASFIEAPRTLGATIRARL